MSTWTAISSWNFYSPSRAWAANGLGTFDAGSSSASRYVFNNANGTKTHLNGVGLDGGSSGNLSWLSLSSVQHIDADGISVIEQITDISALSASVSQFFPTVLGGADIFNGSSGRDQYFGHGGDDLIFGGSGADNLRGGAGTNTFRLTSGDFAAGENIGDVAANDQGYDILQLENVGNLDLRIGTVFGLDVLRYANGISSLTANAELFAGADRINTVIGSSGSDTLTIADASWINLSDMAFSSWSPGEDSLNFLFESRGHFGNVTSTALDETFYLSDASGTLSSGEGDDTFVFANGTFVGGMRLDGGSGTNTIRLNNAAVNYPYSAGASLANIQRIEYGAGNSTFSLNYQNLASPSSLQVVAGLEHDTFRVVPGGQIGGTAIADLSHVTFVNWRDGYDRIVISFGSSSQITATDHADIIQNPGFSQAYGVVINAGAGNDIIVNGRASSTITGGSGSDRFVFGMASISTSYSSTITDFIAAGPEHDVLSLRFTGINSFADLQPHLRQSGNNVTFQYRYETITLQNVKLEDLSAEHFSFRFEQFESQFLATTSFGASASSGGWESNLLYPRLMADINGDQNVDIVGFGFGGVSAALGNGDGTFQSSILRLNAFGSGPTGGGWSNNDDFPRLLGDVNGDGKADIVGFGYGGVYVSMANASGSWDAPTLAHTEFGAGPNAGIWSSNNLYPRALADVNGDGKIDIVGFGYSGVSVSLGNGNGTFQPSTLAIHEFGSSSGAGGWINNNVYPRVLGDVNGDGRDDIVGFGNDHVWVSLANADGTFAQSRAVLQAFGAGTAGGGWTSNDLYPRMLADVDGDTNLDIVAFGDAGVMVARGIGNGYFSAPRSELNAFGAGATGGGWTNNDQYPRLMADLNNDGGADIVGFGYNGVYEAFSNGYFIG